MKNNFYHKTLNKHDFGYEKDVSKTYPLKYGKHKRAYPSVISCL